MTPLAGEALRQRWIEAVVEEGERFGILAQELASGLTEVSGGFDAPVPWVPAWRARDLIGHLGTVHRWATTILRAGSTEPPPPDATQAPPADENLLDWYGIGLVELVATLRTTPGDAPAWHMSPTAEKVAASWARRQAYELAVHRMDLEGAAGVPHAPLDPALAEDGVDELVSIVVPRWAHTEPLATADACVAVTATDTGRTWSVDLVRGAVTVRADLSGSEDAHAQGTATQLLLHLWGRPADVVVDGDPAAEALLRGR
ncbi:maleylpyruvate isomerase N-terminal domain-containing protein [Blastococcus sp. CT_GayMR16]|uniref:maleylpyruvate isomerase N-terminal domain-containing protein n=1 Tax=Blastococcus sp. CT_GayMR16 TaxID=2559607 RepID=UPI00143123DB|nr:maleylpyruvate isomerase N-terminal domain-containing protein [Blastococcus sp. CT_GayMR16]